MFSFHLRLRKFRTFLFFVVFLAGITFSAKATHIMGGDITFSCTGPNQYQVTLTFFRDCKGVFPGSLQILSYASATCGVSSSISLTQVGAAIDVTPVCPGQKSSCSIGANTSFGIQQYTYRGTLTLPPGCGNDWLLRWSSCCRNHAITTLVSPGSTGTYLEATLDNTLTPCNSSPFFNNIPTPIFCVNQPVIYNHGVTDPDGDDLLFSLINCQSSAAAVVNYAGGLSGTNPLTTVGGVSIDPTTGEITFTPSAIQIGVICVLVEEFRNGVKIGETVRDMEFSVISCTNNPPVLSGINGTITYSLNTCPGSNICFQVNGSDPDGGNVTLAWNGGISGGTFTTTGNGTVSPTGVFCWTPTPGDVGTHFFTVSVTDDNCPITGSNIYTFQIIVGPGTHTGNAGVDQTMCPGGTVNLNATAPGATGFTWTPATGLSNPNIANPTASPSITTIYTVSATFADGCIFSGYVKVTVDAGPVVAITPPFANICQGHSVTLTANSGGATSYLWSTGATTPSITVTPVVTTDYWVEVAFAGSCTSRDTVTITTGPLLTGFCNVLYVSPGANGSGLRTDPANLSDALGVSSCKDVVIKMDIGTYVIDTAITNMTSNVTLEGGFDQTNTWRKTSQPGATTIFRSTLNPEGPLNQQRLVAFYINGEQNFRFQDLTIETTSANLSGESTYGVHLTNCSNYDFVRTQVIAGAAGVGGNGADGLDGEEGDEGNDGVDGNNTDPNLAGEGSEGGDGGGGTTKGDGGQIGGCCTVGQNGQDGLTSADPRHGGGGGGGGAGGQGNRNGGSGGAGGGVMGNFGLNTAGSAIGVASGCPTGLTCLSPESGGDGVDGADGFDGNDGVSGSAGVHTVGFWVPSQGTSGENGTGGQGGSAGGGGAGRGGGCTDGGGSGGAGGGGGGGGGFGGIGATGGGSSYAIYLYNNGANASFDDCSLLTGAAVAGALGGVGGGRGNGGNGRNGGNYTGGGEVGCGGDSGAGGRGGKGGDGGDAFGGQSVKLYQNGGAAPVLSDINFFLILQGVIFMENISCANTPMDYTAGGSTSWNLGAGATPATPTGAVVNTQYATSGRKNIIGGSDTYTGFANMIIANQADPIIGTNAPFVNNQYTICEGDAVNFTALNPGLGYIYHWDMDGGATPNNYNGTGFPVLSGIVFSTAGSYDIVLQYETDCCGLSTGGTLTLLVLAKPVLGIAGPTSFCSGTSGVTLTASGGTTYLWSPSIGLSGTTSATVTANPATTQTYSVTTYTGTCYDTTSITVSVNNISLASSSSNVGCLGNDGTATVAPSGGSGNYTYSWPNGQTSATATGLSAGTYQVAVTDAITGCIDSIGIAVNTSPANLSSYISNSTPVSCFGGSDGTAAVAAIGSTGILSYTWINATNNPVNPNALPAGTYRVTTTDNTTGCNSISTVHIPQPNPLATVITNLVLATCGGSNGEATANTSGGTGPYTYTWMTMPNQIGPTAMGLTPGAYLVRITDQNNCKDSTTVSLPCVLPLTFLLFSARPHDQEIQLEWGIVGIQGERRFSIQRRSGNDSFREIAWLQDSVLGIRTFSDVDVSPGEVYQYQIRANGTNGESFYSEIREVRMGKERVPEVQNIYPIPATSSITLEVFLPRPTQISYTFYNAMGAQVLRHSLEMKGGMNRPVISVKDLPDGIYFFQVMAEGLSLGTHKVVVVK